MSESESSYDFGNSLPHSKVSNKQLYYQPYSEEYNEEDYEVPIEPIDNSDISNEVDQQSLHATKNLKETFNQLDKEGKGYIDKKTLKSTVMVTSQQYNKDIIRKEIQKSDQQINYSRFKEIFRMADAADGEVYEWLFSLYDKDKKGYIDEQDLKRASEITGVELTEQQIVQMLMTARNNGQNYVDILDFKQLMDENIQYM